MLRKHMIEQFLFSFYFDIFLHSLAVVDRLSSNLRNKAISLPSLFSNNSSEKENVGRLNLQSLKYKLSIDYSFNKLLGVKKNWRNAKTGL